MKKPEKKAGVLILTIVILFVMAVPVSAQDDFGFGFDDGTGGAADSTAGGKLITGAGIGGKVSAGLQFFFDDGMDPDKLKAAELSDIFSGALNFKASGSNAEGVINLNLTPNFAEPEKILSIDEAYMRAFFGSLNIEGGIRKLTWGKADTLGPLDVINPLDYRDLSNIADPQSIKTARPLIHASYGTGNFSKVEGVFVPWLEGAKFSQTGRWAPAQVTKMAEDIEGKITSDMTARMGGLIALNPGWVTAVGGMSNLMGMLSSINPVDGLSAIDQSAILPQTLGLEYAQGGLRYTTTFGSVDFGVQYYSGFNPRPAMRLNQVGYNALQTAIQDYYTAYMTAYIASTETNPVNKAAVATVAAASAKNAVQTALAKLFDPAYNRYHQIGLDYAQVLWSFNVRAELAANITADLAGDDGLVYNPSLAWSFGFDRDIPVVGINANIQVNESIRLLDDKVGTDSLFDIEAGTNITSTRLTASLSKSFFRNELELRTTAIWGIEDSDCYIIPAVTWTRGDITLEVSAGIFAGSKEGELGQYRDNGFVKTVLSYSF
ncbi:hypothetical protein AGMMS50255_5510 [Spirochaetia bacterium]|nr:hypothetical protein AGMMS50255_5510 [Spirochaetia bacterium]